MPMICGLIMVPVYQSAAPNWIAQKMCNNRLEANLLLGFALYAWTIPTIMGMNMAARAFAAGVIKASSVWASQTYIKSLLCDDPPRRIVRYAMRFATPVVTVASPSNNAPIMSQIVGF